MTAFTEPKKTKSKISLRQKFMRLLGFILIFFTLVFLISFSIIRRKEDDDFKVRTTETAVENVVSFLNSSMDNYNYISRLIMMNESVNNFLNAGEVNKSLSYEARMGMYEILNMSSNISYIESVYIFRSDGEYANTGKGEYTIAMEHPEWERIYDSRGGKIISVNANGMFQKNDGSPILTFSRAIYDIYTQKPKGVLIMNISASRFTEVLALQDTNGICILDKNGNWLCGDKEIGTLYSDFYNSRELVCRTLSFNGKRSAVAAKRANDSLVAMGYTYKVSRVLPRETVFASLLVLGSIIGSVICSALFIRKNLSDPLMRLGEAMEQTKSSGWQPITQEMPNSDLSLLADSYNNMIDYLNQLFEQLRREEEMIRKAEMRVLHEQIKPHFLYNTLETINYIAVQEKAERTYDALETLGSFYRNFLSGGDREIPFERELKITKDYLSLQKLRYGSFEDVYEIDEDTLDYMVPKLILQPLVENSIYHGVKLKGELCTIRISARRQDDGLHILIYDSGVGMSEEKIRSVLAVKNEDSGRDMFGREKGFGLAGTVARIRYYCNDDNVVNIRSEEGEYTKIELLIPNNCRKESEKKNV